MMKQIIYNKNGIRVEVQGTLIVRLPDGRVIDRYPVSEVEEAIRTADEVAELTAIGGIAA